MKKSEIERFAHQTLIDHGMNSIPVDPVKLANKLGIKVSNAVFSESTLSGMIAKRGENLSLLVNNDDVPYRKRFTIAHEIGHSLLHLSSDGEFVDNEVDLFRADSDEHITADYKYEIEANQFAAAVLMDADFVKQYWKEFRSIEKLASIFKVSETAMGFRLNSLGLT
jgi:Zn-dependent peptidase ImmA (M78 family)